MNTYKNNNYENDFCDTSACDNEAYRAGYEAGNRVSTRYLTLNTVRMLHRMGYCAEEISHSCTEFAPALVAAALEQVGRENCNSAISNVEYNGYKGQYSNNRHDGIYTGVIHNTFPQLIFQGTSAETAEEDFKLTADVFSTLGGCPDEDNCFTVEPTDETEWMASIGLENDIRLKSIADAVMDAKILVHRGGSYKEAIEAVADALEEDDCRTAGREEMACAAVSSMFESGISVELISTVLKVPQETVFRILAEEGFDDEERLK